MSSLFAKSAITIPIILCVATLAGCGNSETEGNANSLAEVPLAKEIFSDKSARSMSYYFCDTGRGRSVFVVFTPDKILIEKISSQLSVQEHPLSVEDWESIKKHLSRDWDLQGPRYDLEGSELFTFEGNSEKHYAKLWRSPTKAILQVSDIPR